MSNLRHAFRQLIVAPGFSAIAILILAVGIGISTTIFNGVNPLLFRTLPFHEPASLVAVNESSPKQGFARMNVAYADYAHWRSDNQTFAEMGIWRTRNVTLGGAEPERIEGCYVSATLLPLLGIHPARGRGFHPEEDRPGAAAVVLLGDALWQRRFGGDPDIIGRAIQLNGQPHTVVGVLRPRVRFPNHADLWIPYVVDQPERTHGNFSNNVAARLKPGVSIEQALADLTSISERIGQERPLSNTNVVPVVYPITEAFLDRELRAMGWIMLGAVAFVLAVACANVASLFLTRALARHKEFAIRTALGASRLQTMRQVLAESLALGSIAGAAGLLLSSWGLELLLKMVPVDIPYWIDFSLDARVLAFAVGVSLLTSVLFGVIPAWQASRADVQRGLAETARGSSGGRDRRRLRRWFVVSEVALATLLFCGTGLMLRSLLNLQRVDPGFRPERLSVFNLDLSASGAKTPERRAQFYAQLIERLRATPGVEAATACSNLPLSGGSNGQIFSLEGQPPPADGVNPVADLRIVLPGYFATLQIPLLAGRDFSAGDSASAEKVIVIEAQLARRYFGATDPIGRGLRLDPGDPKSTRTVVGIVGDVKHAGLRQESRPGFYVPHAQNSRAVMGVVVRTTAASPAELFPTARKIVSEIDPAVPMFALRTVRDMIDETYWISRFLGRLLVLFAFLALALAAVGIASVVGYAVTQRTSEIGIRVALGALPRDVVALLLSDGMRMVGLGVVLGLLGSLGLSQLLTSQLYGVGWLDPLTLITGGVTFAAVGLLACVVPARRALRISPVDALRTE